MTGERYLALVPIDKPWSVPTFEVLLRTGERPPAWNVSPGRYRAVCSALGFSSSFLPPFEVQGASSLELNCPVSRLAVRQGRLLAEESGRPLEGGEVGPAWLFVEQSGFGLSAVGMAHLQRNYVSRSDAEGTFVVRGPPGTRADLWARAPGRGAQLVSGVEFPDEERLDDVRLPAGGDVDLTLDLPTGFPAERFRVVLNRAPGGEGPRGDLADLQRRIWLRPVSERLSWRSVPAGSYEVWLKGLPWGLHRDLPSQLAEVEVGAGEVTRVTVAVPEVEGESPLEAAEASVADLPVLLLGESRRLPLETAVELWSDDGPQSLAVGQQMVVSGGLLVQVLGGCSEGIVVVATEDRLAAPIAVEAGSPCPPPSPFERSLAGRAEVQGRLRAPAGYGLPTEGWLDVRGCEPEDAATASYPIALDDVGRWSTPLPAGCRHLVLRTRNFAPQALNAVELTAQEERQLGTVELSPASYLLARVLSGADGRPLEGVSVEAVAESALLTAVRAVLAGESVHATSRGRTDAGGWVRLYGLPAGSFVLHLSHPDFPDRFTDPFSLAAGDETILAEVELPPPARLSVAIEGAVPPAEELRLAADVQIGGCDWQRALWLPVPDTPGSRVELPDLMPGLWQLSLAARSPGAGWNRLLGQEVQLPPGTDEVLTLKLKGALYRARLTWHDEPVEARVSLIPLGLDTELGSQRATSDEAGELSVFLPQPAHFDARVEVASEEQLFVVPGVAFDDPDEVVEIRLPEGRISGWVVDEEGQPVADASVFGSAVIPSRSEDGSERQQDGSLRSWARTDTVGAFVLDGLAGADWYLKATAQGRRSREQTIGLAEDERRSGIELVVGEGTVLSGRLLSDGQPVPGATGWISYEVAPGVMEGWQAFETAVDGTFIARLPPEARREAVIRVRATDGRVAAWRRPISQDLVLHVPAIGGRVEIRPRDLSETIPTSRWRLVNDEGAYIPFWDAPSRRLPGGREGTEDGELIVLPALAPGSWRLEGALDGAAPVFVPLATFEVQPGQTTVVAPALPSSN